MEETRHLLHTKQLKMGAVQIVGFPAQQMNRDFDFPV